jgi:hypothetical protein
METPVTDLFADTFTLDSKASEYADLPIVAVWATGYPPMPLSKSKKAPRPETNHWTLNFAFNDSESVRLNPNPFAEEQVLSCTIDHKPYLYTNNAVRIQRLEAKDLTINNFIDIVKGNGYHRYKFTQGRQGCRYWIISTLKLLQKAGKFVDEAEFDDTMYSMHRTWDADGVTENGRGIPVLKGKFLKESKWKAISPYHGSRL